MELKNPQGYTPLMTAVYHDYEEIAESLITAGTCNSAHVVCHNSMLSRIFFFIDDEIDYNCLINCIFHNIYYV